MRYEVEVALPVPAEQAWALLSDLRSWPTWTPTVEYLEAPADRPRPGLPVTVKQPGRAAAHYRVDVVEEGRRFRWGSRRGGVRQSADHLITATGERSCTVTLSFAMTGSLGAILGRLGAGKIRSMVDAEARGLRGALVPAAS